MEVAENISGSKTFMPPTVSVYKELVSFEIRNYCNNDSPIAVGRDNN